LPPTGWDRALAAAAALPPPPPGLSGRAGPVGSGSLLSGFSGGGGGDLPLTLLQGPGSSRLRADGVGFGGGYRRPEPSDTSFVSAFSGGGGGSGGGGFRSGGGRGSGGGHGGFGF
jgi:translation initiation factor IF-2